MYVQNVQGIDGNHHQRLQYDHSMIRCLEIHVYEGKALLVLTFG